MDVACESCLATLFGWWEWLRGHEPQNPEIGFSISFLRRCLFFWPFWHVVAPRFGSNVLLCCEGGMATPA